MTFERKLVGKERSLEAMKTEGANVKTAEAFVGVDLAR